MIATSSESAIDEIIDALLTMRLGDIEDAQSRLDEIRELSPNIIVKLRQTRAAAVNACRLWQTCLGASDDLIYSSTGETTSVARGSRTSITA